MGKSKNKATLPGLSEALKKDFEGWDSLMRNGGRDPFYSDGVNLNLIRNHIIFDKRRIEAFINEENEELTLFPLTVPSIYKRQTPDSVGEDFMVKSQEIQQRAREQVALYENDISFKYLLAVFHEVFPDGKETPATKKAKLPFLAIYHLQAYRAALDSGDLVAMRREYWNDYAKKSVEWQHYASLVRDYLSKKHDPENGSAAQKVSESDLPKDTGLNGSASSAPLRPRLDDLIDRAKHRQLSHIGMYSTKEEALKEAMSQKRGQTIFFCQGGYFLQETSGDNPKPTSSLTIGCVSDPKDSLEQIPVLFDYTKSGIWKFIETLDVRREYRLAELFDLHNEWCAQAHYRPLPRQVLHEALTSKSSVGYGLMDGGSLFHVSELMERYLAQHVPQKALTKNENAR